MMAYQGQATCERMAGRIGILGSSGNGFSHGMVGNADQFSE
jgi:hypothetical protein